MWPLSLLKSGRNLVDILLVVGVISIVALMFFHYNHVMNELSDLKAERVALKQTIKVDTETINKAVTTIKDWQDSQKKFTDAINEMVKTNKDASGHLRRLNETLAKHDLSLLSHQHPQTIERIINGASNDSMRMLSCISGVGGLQSCGVTATGQTPGIAQPKPH